MLFLFLQFIAAVTEFVKNELGQQFIESPAADLAEVYKDLNNTTPLIFVLSQGSGMDCQQCCFLKWLYVGYLMRIVGFCRSNGWILSICNRNGTFRKDVFHISWSGTRPHRRVND
jgi:hypothetical protein